MTQLQGGGADLTDHNDNSGDERRGSLLPLFCRWKKTTRDKKQESGGRGGRLRLLQQEDEEEDNKAQDVSLFPKSKLISVYVRASAFA